MDPTELFVPLVIKNPSNNSDFKVEVPLEWSVAELKRKLYREYDGNPDPEAQKLIYAGQLLIDTGILREAFQQSLQSPDEPRTLHMVVREKNGSRSSSIAESPAPQVAEERSPASVASAPSTPVPTLAAASPAPVQEAAPSMPAPAAPPATASTSGQPDSVPSTPVQAPNASSSSPPPSHSQGLQPPLTPPTPQSPYAAAMGSYYPGVYPGAMAASPIYMAAYNAALAALSPASAQHVSAGVASPHAPASPMMFSPYMPPPMPYGYHMGHYAMPYAHPGQPGVFPQYPGAQAQGTMPAAPAEAVPEA
eukprot:CAMPEP_0182877640 /NCGR_PEP_ID=MMETSP0034_2-20130328/14880_1 /TAXON_ID=156128 /ORGANISM="Nephroselmis pyriformis, Strain CCMP717" /LENGTH=306 /DNA_ID=CAMNT_0025010491 /DNA_START=104 /DNA_END=1021 /DNA_ORIENTATION=+